MNRYFHNGNQQGFTLIELLAVVVIVAILFTYTTLAIRTDSPEDFIKQEANRFKRLTQLATEESILRGEEYAIEVFTDGYRFLRFTENKWMPLEDDKLLKQRELPQDMELEISLEETEIVIDLASNALSQKKLDLSFSLDTNTDEEDETDNKNKPKPQIYILSSGEITPEFDIRFYILGVETSYFVHGAFDGTLKAEISDL